MTSTMVSYWKTFPGDLWQHSLVFLLLMFDETLSSEEEIPVFVFILHAETVVTSGDLLLCTQGRESH